MNQTFVILIFIDNANNILLIKENDDWNFPIEKKKETDIIPFFTAIRAFENTTSNRLQIHKITKEPQIKIIVSNDNTYNTIIIIKSDQNIMPNISNFKCVSFTELYKIAMYNKNKIILQYYLLIKKNIELILSLKSPNISSSKSPLIKSISSPKSPLIKSISSPKSPLIKSISSPELSFNKSPKLSFKKSPELSFNKSPKLSFKKSPELSFNKSPKLSFKKSPNISSSKLSFKKSNKLLL